MNYAASGRFFDIVNGFLIDAVAHGTRSTSFGGFGFQGVWIGDHVLHTDV